MTLLDLPWGFWNGLTAWIILVAHAFSGWTEFPLFDVSRDGNWYAFGFLLGAGSPFLGAARRGRTKQARPARRSTGRSYPNASFSTRQARKVTHLLACPCCSKSTQVLPL
jgi:hypothetical protein